MSTADRPAMAVQAPSRPGRSRPGSETEGRAAAKKFTHYPFWLGGSSSMAAAAVTHPLDLAKVRMQMNNSSSDGFLRTIANVYRREGARKLYAGLSASLLRQATYSTTRFGVYEELKRQYQGDDVKVPPAHVLVALACVSGFAGALVGNPADILNVRMQNDQTLPEHKRRNYRHALDGLVRMLREEGVASLFRGAGTNCARGVLMTASQLASYDAFKHALLGTGHFHEGLVTHFSASLLAGFVATVVCSPFDVVKTRIMSGKKRRSVLEVVRWSVRTDGWGFAFKGFVPSFIRLGPHTIVTFMVLEQQKKWYRWATSDVESTATSARAA